MKRAYHTEAVVDDDGTVRLRDVPFGAGETIEVIVLPQSRPVGSPSPIGSGPTDRSLQGTVSHYDDPFEPVAVDDWDAQR